VNFKATALIHNTAARLGPSDVEIESINIWLFVVVYAPSGISLFTFALSFSSPRVIRASIPFRA